MILRSCTKCGAEKALHEFSKQKRGRDGLHSHCKACRKADMQAWRAANPDKILASARKRVEDGRARQQAKDYRGRNPHKVIEYNRRRYIERPDVMRELARRYLASLPPEIKRARKAAWKRSNPESVKASANRNRAKRLTAPGSHTAQELRDLFKRQNGKCAVCRMVLPKQYHEDHIQPIARGGSNDITNIQLLCRPCNQAKSAKDPVDFMQERGFLL